MFYPQKTFGKSSDRHNMMVPTTNFLQIIIIYYRPLFKELKLSGEKHIILDYEVEHIMRILGQADEVHFMGDYQSFVITNLVSEMNILQ